ncbi:MAG: hypothetical protein WCU80_06900 [Paludibacteraceae bacterium]
METKDFHIGKIVETAFIQSGLTKTEFAKAIGIHNQNLNREFEKQDWSVLKLIDAGKALHFDFSYLFAEIKKKEQKTEVVLQIKIEDSKVNEVLKVIENKELYSILKK